MASANETFYILRDSGQIQRCRTEDVVISNQVVSKIAGQISFGAPYVVPCGDKGELMSYCLRNNETILGIRLKQVTLCTNYLYKDGFLYPCFGEHPGFIKLTSLWQVPDSMQLFFIVACVGPPKEFSNQYINQCYMYARHTNQKKYPGFFKLQLSNTYEDGRICMGESLKSVRCSNYGQTIIRAIEILNGANWNADLTPRDVDLSKNIFKFNPMDMSTVAVEDTWPKSCVKCSHPYIEAINAYL